MNSVKQGQGMEESSPILENEIKGQGVFVGRFTHSLDPKKRLTIPSEWRAQVGNPRSLYVLPDIHHRSLCVFPAGEMARRLAKMRDYSIADETARRFARVLGSQSDLVAWDSQGRIRIKDELLSFAGLSEKVVMIGAIDRFELWNPQSLTEGGGIDQGDIEEAARYVGF